MEAVVVFPPTEKVSKMARAGAANAAAESRLSRTGRYCRTKVRVQDMVEPPK
jgi:hypothetical protein